MCKFKIETHLKHLKSKIDDLRNISQAGVLLEANTVPEKCDNQVDKKLYSDAFAFSAKEATSKPRNQVHSTQLKKRTKEHEKKILLNVGQSR